jgi:amidohydrolase
MENTKLQETLLPHFQWFHRHPELSCHEFETTKRIRSVLREWGVEILDSGLETGVIALIRGEEERPPVALRADIDALPITEQTGLPYASENSGCMHACGHDFHTTALLGAALLLSREKPAGPVKIVFQPDEEGSSGAENVLKTGLLSDVAKIFGLHCAPAIPAGTAAISAGEVYAAAGAFSIRIRGRGGHAAAPHLAIDPIITAAQIINAAQTIVSRNADPFESLVVSVTRVAAGTSWNIIPDEAFLEGTIRAMKTERLEEAAENLRGICEGAARSGFRPAADGQPSGGLAATGGLAVDFSWRFNVPAVKNDGALAEFAAETARRLDIPVIPCAPVMGSEDFALYLQHIPGVFLNFGVGSPCGLHSPGFTANPHALTAAARLLAALARGA